MKYQGVIFDLDGVIVSTDECHYQAWKKLAIRENIPFDRTDNERLRGVSRAESLEIILEKSKCTYTESEKQEMLLQKNIWYRNSLDALTPEYIFPGVEPLLTALKQAQIKIAIGSSSKNTNLILEKIGLSKVFDAVADGNLIQNSKPAPEVFLLAASLLNLAPENCIVIEDAPAGILAAKRANVKTVAVGKSVAASHADYIVNSIAEINLKKLLS